ncbi:MAG: hemolysin III family protein [bacterium]|nr:hemolysin III family protein [bacterium]
MSLKDRIEIPKYTLSEELISAITHGIGAILSIVALVLCVTFSSIHNNVYAIVSSCIYGSMSIILYSISTIYHSLKVNNAKRVFRIIDHCSIYLLIAGTYTPYCLVALPTSLGWTLFGIIWACAVLGIVLNSIDLKKFKTFSMILYIVMGWMIIFSIKPLINSINIKGIYFMFTAGILYTVGSIFYGIGKRVKYMHSVFHIFVLLASVFFFFSIFLYII